MTFSVSHSTGFDVIIMSNVRGIPALPLVTSGRDGILFPTQNVKSESDRAVIQMTGGDRDDDWQDEAGSVLCYLSVLLQSWLTREERQMAARINMTYARPEQFQPSCGTSDPSIMQVSDSDSQGGEMSD